MSTTTRRWHIPILLVILAGIGGYAPTGWTAFSQYIQHHPYFSLSDIDVELEPGALFSQEEILAWSEISRGMNLWTVDPVEVSARLLAYQGIRAVEVRREFPHRVVMQVYARHPIAVIAQPTLTYLASDGMWFPARAQKQELDLPYVTGFGEDELSTVSSQSALSGIAPLLSLAKNFWAEPVSELHWDTTTGYTVFLTRRHLTIRLGWETGPEKFAQVATVLAKWPVDGPAASFDARFLNQVVVRPFPEESGLRSGIPADPL
jgi:cell division septal protein FtsQ